ncbi:MAG: hypothetical protein KBD46_01560 [Candidatus Levybacteria bacterium]|nr:hypothetical protein [Candidatus Levybacteria bacterium]
MRGKSVELQMVSYDTRAIAHAAGRLVYNFAAYSGIQGTEYWTHALPAITQICEEQQDSSCTLKTEGVIVQFSGFPSPIPRISENGVIYAPRAPRFTIQPQEGELIPTVRTHLHRFTNALADEMETVYKLDARENGAVLIFPKRHYATNIEVVKVPLLA